MSGVIEAAGLCVPSCRTSPIRPAPQRLFFGAHPDEDPVSGLYALSGRGKLMGEEYRPTAEVDPATFAVDDLDRLLVGAEPVLVLTGTVADGGRESEHVVAALDGRIVAVSPVVERANGGPAFALLLPTDRPVDLRRVRLGLVRGSEVLDAGAVGA